MTDKALGEGRRVQKEPLKKGKAFRYLGAYLTPELNWEVQEAHVGQQITALLSLLSRKKFVNIAGAQKAIQACIGGTINFYGAYTLIGARQAEKWDKQIVNVVRGKVGGLPNHTGWFSNQDAKMACLC